MKIWLFALDKLFFPYKKEWFYFDLHDTEKKLKDYFIIDDKKEDPNGSSMKDATFTYVLKLKK